MIPDIATFVQDKTNLTYRILSFDPGETVGWALTCNGTLLGSGQFSTANFTADEIDEIRFLISTHKPDIVVYETYLIYSWKAESHTWNEVHTAQIIGIIRMVCLALGVPYAKQTAQIAKQFCTDDKLKGWGFWSQLQRHSRDALRHNLYWLMFGTMSKTWTALGAPPEKK